MTYDPRALQAAAGFDPQSFSNWTLLHKKTWNNEPIGTHQVSISGDQYDRIKIITHMPGGDGTESSLGLRFNNDSGNNYNRLFHYGGDAHGSVKDTRSEIYLGQTDNQVSYVEAILTPKSGAPRGVMVDREYWGGSSTGYIQQLYYMWNNTTDEITTLDFFDISGTSNCNCVLEIYAWQEIKPVELHSYELVKEYKLDNETLDETISWDGTVDDVIYIESSLSGGWLGLQMNGDSGGNYGKVRFYANGASVGTDITTTDTYIHVCPGGNVASMARSVGHLNGADRKSFINDFNIQLSSTNYRYGESRWWVSTAAVTSVRLFNTDANVSTGWIRVYKRAKTHLVSQNPDLLRGLWQKSVDANTIEVQPGRVDIFGTICSLTKAKQVTLSGNLRSGESEASSTYYYLYAIKEAGRTCSFKFSSVAPTMDVFGNVVSSFEDCDMSQAWYHPNEVGWRYVGQVYNDSSGNILGFDKCKPGYWESQWRAFDASSGSDNDLFSIPFLGHTMDAKLLASKDSPSTGNYTFEPYYFDGTIYRGARTRIEGSSTVDVVIVGGGKNFFDGTSWQTTGYYKLILTA